jgi:tetratricopeptide (TPR) repeat protein
VMIGQMLVDQGRLDEAETVLTGCVRIFRASRDRYLLGCALIPFGRARTHSGRCDQGLEALEEAKSSLEEVGAQAEVIEAEASIAEAYVYLGRSTEALSTIEKASEDIRGMGGQSPVVSQLERAKGYALWQLDRLEEAATAFETAWKTARERSSDLDVALTSVAIERLSADGVQVNVTDRSAADEIVRRLDIVAVESPQMPRRA